jgi:hypothetical protein
MLNQVVLVGKVLEINRTHPIHTLKVVLNVPLQAIHPLTVVIPNTLHNIIDTVAIPNIIAIKAHLESDSNGKIEVIAERISYIKSGEEHDV